jgi:hypothetical protein
MAPEIQAAILGGIFILVSTLLTIFLPRWLDRKEPEAKAKRSSREKPSLLKKLGVFLAVGVFLLTLYVFLTPRYTDNGDGTITDNLTGQVTNRYTENSDGTVTDNLIGQVINRYTDNSDGTVTDNRTGLIWLKNANCFGEQDWKTAMQSAANLADGQCGLRDGSKLGDWRLPTIVGEWEAMVDERYEKHALSNAAGTSKWQEGDVFVGVKSDSYWSSTTRANRTDYAWVVALSIGNINFILFKTSTIYVWPVRGGYSGIEGFNPLML